MLIGDAAGHNDPIIGQGLSITYRDVRIVRDVLLGSDDWSPAAFAAYGEERRERMRRLRFVATLQSRLENEFGEEAEARRQRAYERARCRSDADAAGAGDDDGAGEDAAARVRGRRSWRRHFA